MLFVLLARVGVSVKRFILGASMSKRNISKRGEGCKALPKGYCLICGNHRILSKDHVPPKAALLELGEVTQMLMSEVFGSQVDPNLKGIKGNNGSTFKTICEVCNNKYVGENDAEVAKVFKAMHSSIRTLAATGIKATSPLKFNLDAEKFLKAMVGHVLSATTNLRCKQPISKDDQFQPLRDFVLGENLNIMDTHDFYYWFYPFKRHISALGVSLFNEGDHIPLSCLHFYPLAFLITPKNQGVYPVHANALTLSTKELWLNISRWNLDYASFPFCNLKGNQMLAIDDNSCVTSFPYGQ